MRLRNIDLIGVVVWDGYLITFGMSFIGLDLSKSIFDATCVSYIYFSLLATARTSTLLPSIYMSAAGTDFPTRSFGVHLDLDLLELRRGETVLSTRFDRVLLSCCLLSKAVKIF